MTSLEDFEKEMDAYLEQTSVFPHISLEDEDDDRIKNAARASRYQSAHLIRRRKLEKSIQRSINRYWARERK